MKKNTILSKCQQGFQSTNSTVNQIIEIDHRIISNTDSGKYVRLLFCDMPMAFDKVWHTSYSSN